MGTRCGDSNTRQWLREWKRRSSWCRTYFRLENSRTDQISEIVRCVAADPREPIEVCCWKIHRRRPKECCPFQYVSTSVLRSSTTFNHGQKLVSPIKTSGKKSNCLPHSPDTALRSGRTPQAAILSFPTITLGVDGRAASGRGEVDGFGR